MAFAVSIARISATVLRSSAFASVFAIRSTSVATEDVVKVSIRSASIFAPMFMIILATSLFYLKGLGGGVFDDLLCDNTESRFVVATHGPWEGEFVVGIWLLTAILSDTAPVRHSLDISSHLIIVNMDILIVSPH